MNDAVVEISGDVVSVTLHPSHEDSVSYAVEIAKECTSYSEDEIREHLRQGDEHSEGDYRVILAKAREYAKCQS